MIRLFHAYFPVRTLLLVVSDTVFILTGLLVATLFWSYIGGNPDHLDSYAKLAVVIFVLAMCLYYYDLYESDVVANSRELTTRLVQVLGTSCVLLAILYYAYPEMQLERGAFITGILLTGSRPGRMPSIVPGSERGSQPDGPNADPGSWGAGCCIGRGIEKAPGIRRPRDRICSRRDG